MNTRSLRFAHAVLIIFGALIDAPRAAAQPAARPPAFMLGSFVDDYDVRYRVTPDLFLHGMRTRYEIAEWHVDERYFIARQRADSTGRSPWVRVDWMEFTGMPPYTWGYCFTKYDATSAASARAAAPARRDTPRTGCGGFPFSRMRRVERDSAPAKAVFIILDGIPADVIERVPTPAIDAIAAAGGYARASVGGELGGRTETPTISAPGYMSLLTATWGYKHNVWNNSPKAPNYDYWNIFRIVETVDPSRKTAIFSTWLDNRTVLVGEGRPGAGDFRIDHAVDGFERDTVAFPHDSASRYIAAIDARVAAEAAAYIATRGPDLSWVYLQHTDDAAHANGDSEASDAAVRQADAYVGRIWDAVKQRRALGEDWMIVVTTDHGRDPVTGKGHGGQSARERNTWIATNQPNLGERFTRGTPAVVDIAPSILQHLRIAVPADVAARMDGVSFLSARVR